MGKTSREKGKRGERELANKLREYGYDTHRGVQYQGGPESPDVVGLPGIHVEVKRTEAFRLEEALSQAQADAGPDDLPAVFHRKNGRPWCVVMPLDSWMALYNRAQSQEGSEAGER